MTQTEVRLIFRDVAPLTFLAQQRQPSANELVLRIDPDTGLRMILEAHRADAPGPEPITLGMDFAHQGGVGPTPYETLFEAALTGDHSPFTRQETVEEAWRIVQPLLDSRRQTHSYRRGSFGPKAANDLLPTGQHWRRPWAPDSPGDPLQAGVAR
jgi:glucose-6-phosphate 1-dehydrogenase